MSLYDYRVSQQLERDDAPFYALIMAAMRKADTENLAKLRAAWPEVWDEMYQRYHAPGGLLPEDKAFGIFQSMDKQLAELRRELRETREANDGLAILAQKTAKAAAQWAEEFRKARDELNAVQAREAKGVEVFDGIVAELRAKLKEAEERNDGYGSACAEAEGRIAELRTQLKRADREVQRLTNLVNQQAERDAASTIDHFRQRAERLERALKALADFDPNDSLKEGWTGGWCWCGGSVRHRAPCLQARAALDFSATERRP